MSSESSKNEQIEDDSLQSDYDNNDFEGLSSVKLFLDELNEKNYDFAQIDNRNFLLKDSVSKNLGKNNEIWEQDQEEWTKTLNKNQNSLINICKKTKDLEKYLEESPQKTKDGLSFLDVKNQLFLSYLQYLLMYMLFRSQGKPINNHPLVKRLIFLKSLLLKLKPIEKKLDYQISKLLRATIPIATNGNSLAREIKDRKEFQEDPLSFKPRPDKLQKERTTENLDIDESGQIVEKKNEIAKYKPPKISAVLSKEDKISEKRLKQLERKRKFMLRTSFVNDLSGEFSSKPSTGQTNYFDKEEKARIQFEEDNFVRLPIKKQDKIREKKRMREARDDKIDDFREMENIREVLKLDGMIEEEGKKEERERKLNKTLSGFKKKKGIKKFPKRKF